MPCRLAKLVCRSTDAGRPSCASIVPRELVPAYLGVLERALSETARRGRLWCGQPTADADAMRTCCCTTERLLGGHLNLSGVPVRRVLLPVLLVRSRADPPATHLPGSWLAEHTGPREWGERADELPVRAREDLLCLRIPLEHEFAVALEACASVRGRGVTAMHALTHGRGTDSRIGRLVALVVLSYLTLGVCMCLRRRQG